MARGCCSWEYASICKARLSITHKYNNAESHKIPLRRSTNASMYLDHFVNNPARLSLYSSVTRNDNDTRPSHAWRRQPRVKVQLPRESVTEGVSRSDPSGPLGPEDHALTIPASLGSFSTKRPSQSKRPAWVCLSRLLYLLSLTTLN